ncbi:ABC transporter substrate-binding protein [Pseudoroseomonas globiformis]|uniref:ABC transporter substrate-binding protein n=1 Tax=Teichococcus globiformis TaxID=2307229 RepID=A0ABV7G7U9_9PROT
MAISANRRAILAGAAATGLLPFLRVPTARSQPSGLLRFGLSSYPPNIQPWANSGTAAATVKLMIYRGLTSYDEEGRLRPELAEAWTREGDTAWVFKLRDATFQNGEKVTAADVKWTLEQIASEKSTAHFRTEIRGIERIETPDDRTVRLVTRAPMVTLPNLMASYHMPIISRQSSGREFIGAGPFSIKSQERGSSLELEAFNGFYKPGLPKLKTIRITAYADENLRVAALQSGDVDLIEYVPWQSMATIADNKQLKLDAVDGAFMYLIFNGSKPPFDDARIRKAVAYAIRRDEVVKAAFFGRGSPLGHLPIAESSPFFNPELKDGWTYNPDLAKKLMAEAGHPNGFACNMLSTAQYGMHKDSAEVVQQHLAAIGIQVTLNLPDWATRIAIGNRGQYDLAMMGTAADSNDPDGLANILDGSLATAYIRSYGLKTPRISELFAAGRAEFDEARRRAIYRELEQVAIEEAPIVGLTWRSQGYAMRSQVSGFKNLPGALTFYSGLTFETASLG